MKNQQNGNIARQQKAMDLWLPRKVEIMELYAMGDQSQAQMAERYGVTLAGFQKALARLGIAPKSRGRAGKANGRFKDGTQSTAYRALIEKTHCNCRLASPWAAICATGVGLRRWPRTSTSSAT